jgi:hypothetical protein
MGNRACTDAGLIMLRNIFGKISSDDNSFFRHPNDDLHHLIEAQVATGKQDHAWYGRGVEPIQMKRPCADKLRTLGFSFVKIALLERPL